MLAPPLFLLPPVMPPAYAYIAYGAGREATRAVRERRPTVVVFGHHSAAGLRHQQT
jgi:hypothetical protein